MHCLPFKQLLASPKVSIDTLMGGMQQVVLENKRFDSQKRSKTFALSRFFGP